MTLQILLDVYVAAVGLVVGSYVNVVIHRLPRGHSTVLPRSRCPHCDAVIRPADNLPLLSYLVLRGKCRSCGAPISFRYPAVEALTAILFVAAFEIWGTTLHGLFAAVFVAVMIALAGIDLEHFILPDAITLPGIVIALVASPWLPWIRWQEALVGAVAGGAGLWLLAEAWLLVRGEEGMGLGDAKMLALIGAALGWRGMLVALFTASFAGAVVGIVLVLLGRLEGRSRLPFGVFLAGGALVALFAGDPIVTAYSRLL